jgi:hypothetical protein
VTALALRKRYPSESRVGDVIPALVAIAAAAVVALLEYHATIPRWVIR